MEIESGQEYVISTGNKQIQAHVPDGGFINIEASQDGLPYGLMRTITQPSFLSDHMCHCKVKVTLSGGARLSINPSEEVKKI